MRRDVLGSTMIGTIKCLSCSGRLSLYEWL
uniref:Uncharacterized protein n=1 Tax=Anguilla anguilla TaxID=7936 RepID=A0A0E9UNS0_ANGAN